MVNGIKTTNQTPLFIRRRKTSLLDFQKRRLQMFGSNEESFTDLEKLEILLETIPHLGFSLVKVYFLLKEISNKEKIVVTSYSELSRYFKMDRHAVSSAIEGLKAHKLISVDQTRDEKTNALIIFLRPMTEGWNKINLKWKAELLSCDESIQTEKDVILQDPVIKLYYSLKGVDKTSTFDVKRNYEILKQIRSQDKFEDEEIVFAMRKCFINAHDNGKEVKSMQYVAGFIGNFVKEKQDDDTKKNKAELDKRLREAKDAAKSKEDEKHFKELERNANSIGLTYTGERHIKIDRSEIDTYLGKATSQFTEDNDITNKIKNDIKSRWVYKLEEAIAE